MNVQILIQDIYILGPLQLTRMPLGELLSLVNHDRPGTKWFHKEFTFDEVVRTLRRMADRQIVVCHADNAVASTPIPCPPMPQLQECWFDLAPQGLEILSHPAPWNYEIDQWLFPSDRSLLSALVEDIRSYPRKWIFEPLSSGDAVAYGLKGYTSFRTRMRKLDGSTLDVHVIERSDDPTYELVHGHFLASVTNEKQILGMGQLASGSGLTNVDLMILDALQDDVESVLTLTDLLNNETLEYKRRHFGQDFSSKEIHLSLDRLVAKDLVVVFRESGEKPVTLVPYEGALSSNMDGLWFALSEEGRKRAKETADISLQR